MTTGESHEDIPNDSGPTSSTALVTTGEFESKALLRKSLERYASGINSPDASIGLESGERRIRRGRYFLSRHDQLVHGSLRRPILQYFAHGLLVEEMQYDPHSDGDWCFGSHNDFELIPESTPKSKWPVYVRTETGFTKAENQEQLVEKPDPSFTERLLEITKDMKRLT